MKVIVIANQKGGSGKSTALIHLATAAGHAGEGPVVFTDTDPQGTSSKWFNRRQKAGLEEPRFAPVALDKLKEKITALRKAGVPYLFIDTAPSVGDANKEIYSHADIILVPLNPTPADLDALSDAMPLLRKAGKPICYMLARVRPNLKSNDAVTFALSSLGLVLPTRMHERVIYSDTIGHGRTALEIDPKGVAARELLNVWHDLRKFMAEIEDRKL